MVHGNIAFGSLHLLYIFAKIRFAEYIHLLNINSIMLKAWRAHFYIAVIIFV